MYQDRDANDNEEAYVRVVFAKVDNPEVSTNFVKEKIFPIYEEAEGLRGAGFFIADGEAVSWNIWDSEEAANTVVPKFNEELSSAEGIFLKILSPIWGICMRKKLYRCQKKLRKEKMTEEENVLALIWLT